MTSEAVSRNGVITKSATAPNNKVLMRMFERRSEREEVGKERISVKRGLFFGRRLAGGSTLCSAVFSDGSGGKGCGARSQEDRRWAR